MTLPVAGNYRFSVRAVNIVGSSALSVQVEPGGGSVTP